jgi:hypothetical protein
LNRLRFSILILLALVLLILAKYYPAMGMEDDHTAQDPPSGAIYTFHSINHTGDLLPLGTCQVCHTGPLSQNTRQALSSMGVNCTDCHAGMSALEIPQHLRGIMLVTCSSCHGHEMAINISSSYFRFSREITASNYLVAPASGVKGLQGELNLSETNNADVNSRATGSGESYASTHQSVVNTTKCEECHPQIIRATFRHFEVEE